jgi:hypothetical protein
MDVSAPTAKAFDDKIQNETCMLTGFHPRVLRSFDAARARLLLPLHIQKAVYYAEPQQCIKKKPDQTQTNPLNIPPVLFFHLQPFVFTVTSTLLARALFLLSASAAALYAGPR